MNLAELVREAIRVRGERLATPPGVRAAAVDGHHGLQAAVADVAAAPLPPPHAAELTRNPTIIGVEAGSHRFLVWRDPQVGRVRVRAAEAPELAALELARGIDEGMAAASAGVRAASVVDLIEDAIACGLLLAPAAGLRRWPDGFPAARDAPAELQVSRWFTLQWHLTMACDLHCLHCYDRSRIDHLPLPDALRVVDDVVGFCRRRRVAAEFCLTGGNPLLYPRFLELYRGIHATGSSISILGNPIKRSRLEAMCAIAPPSRYQVSLEGLEAHDDAIRGAGHFRRTLEFLDWLRELGIESAVMLTLTRDNLDQVLPLAELLRDRVDVFTFNRLAQIGEGAALAIPSPDEYEAFRGHYRAAALDNPAMRFKDNLFNVDQHRAGRPPLGGCTGSGCGAAYSFIALLPDGQAHACRKLPSPMGDLARDGIEAVWESAAARAWREGPEPCRACPVRPACGGCPAVTHGAGGRPLRDRDPHCTLS